MCCFKEAYKGLHMVYITIVSSLYVSLNSPTVNHPIYFVNLPSQYFNTRVKILTT